MLKTYSFLLWIFSVPSQILSWVWIFTRSSFFYLYSDHSFIHLKCNTFKKYPSHLKINLEAFLGTLCLSISYFTSQFKMSFSLHILSTHQKRQIILLIAAIATMLCHSLLCTIPEKLGKHDCKLKRTSIRHGEEIILKSS